MQFGLIFRFFFFFFWVKQKRTRVQAQTSEKQASKANGAGAENRERTSEASDQTGRESSPDDFEEARPGAKRNRANEGTSGSAHKATDQSLIGKSYTKL
jgi:hypothetical protein